MDYKHLKKKNRVEIIYFQSRLHFKNTKNQSIFLFLFFFFRNKNQLKPEIVFQALKFCNVSNSRRLGLFSLAGNCWVLCTKPLLHRGVQSPHTLSKFLNELWLFGHQIQPLLLLLFFFWKVYYYYLDKMRHLVCGPIKKG